MLLEPVTGALHLRLVLLDEELVIVHNLDVQGARRQEKDDFDYAFDFSEVYRPMDEGRGYTRRVPLADER